MTSYRNHRGTLIGDEDMPCEYSVLCIEERSKCKYLTMRGVWHDVSKFQSSLMLLH